MKHMKHMKLVKRMKHVKLSTQSIHSIHSTLSQQSAMHNECLQADLVLEGGGVRGIGHVGALSVMEEQGYSWQHIAGTSAGAYVAALLAAGHSASAGQPSDARAG